MLKSCNKYTIRSSRDIGTRYVRVIAVGKSDVTRPIRLRPGAAQWLELVHSALHVLTSPALTQVFSSLQQHVTAFVVCALARSLYSDGEHF